MDERTCIEWSSRVFGECVESDRHVASIIIGYLSIGCWICAQLPQVIKNFRLGQAHSLSAVFLAVWWFGDVCNLLGSILTHQLPFQKYLATYFVFIDTVLVCQYVLYVVILRRVDETGIDDESVSLLGSSRAPSGILTISHKHDLNDDENEGNDDKSKNTTGQTRSGLKSYGSITWTTMLSCAIALALAPVSSAFPTDYFPSISHLGSQFSHYGTQDSTGEVFGQVCAWASLVSYLFSRLPQIVKNHQRGTVEGLSVYMFIFAALGNTTYTLSVLLKSTDPEFLYQALPFLLGSSGTLLFDFTIFAQSMYYNRSNSTYSRL